jgi:glycosyltransferase involved in cell wall biosynthesis
VTAAEEKPMTTTAAPHLSILVVGYNAADWLDRCLTSVFGPGSPSRTFEVVLVDNASTPPLAGVLDQDDERLRIVTLEQNVGFGAGVNLAASLSSGDNLLLLNPDTEVLPGSIDALCDFLEEDPSRGLVGGRTVGPDGALDARSSWAAPTLWSQFCFATGLTTALPRSPRFNPEPMPGWARDTERDVDVVTGCLLLVGRELWQDLGGFDTTFFMYGEDVVHAGGASSTTAAKTEMVLRGKATLYRKHGTRWTRQLSQILLKGGVGLRALLEGRRGPQHDRVWRSAWRARRDWGRGWLPGHQVPVQIAVDTGVPR